MSRYTVLFSAVVLVASANPCFAGKNFGGTARLSWSPLTQVSDRPTIPAQPVPLYLILDGVPDLQSLAVQLRWSPNDPTGPCYYVVPADTATSGCGSTGYRQSPGVFEGDSTFDWQIAFDGTSHGCVQYKVGGPHCDGKAASFCLRFVKTRDSDGAVDELKVLGGATILGGVADGCPVVAEDIFPHVAVLGRKNSFTIQGRALSPETSVALVDNGAAATATSVTVVGDTTATASVEIPAAFTGVLDVVVTTPTASDTLADRVAVADSSSGLTPVWELDVTELGGAPHATVVGNEFINPAYSTAFPSQTVPVNRKVTRSNTAGGGYEPDFAVDVAPLDLDLHGQPTASSLAFVSYNAVSVDPRTGRIAVLAQSGLGPAQTLPPALAARAVSVGLRATSNGPLLGWNRSPDNRWMVIRSERATSVFASSNVTESLHIPGRAYEGSFSSNGQRYAAVVEDDRGRRWVALAPDHIVAEGPRTRDALSQLELSPDGSSLTFSRQSHPGGPAATVAVNLATGEERALANMPDGTRYYAADGRTAVVLTANPGSLRLFDVSNPLAPVELATAFEMTGAVFVTSAVSGDGGILALQMLETNNNPHNTLMRTIVLDRNLHIRATVSGRSDLTGLQFEGRFLFVGTQRHPVPAYFLFNPTTKIRLYDLSGL